MVSSLRNASEELAAKVAAGLGMKELPDPMPRALETVVKPEITISPALAQFSKPGRSGI